VVTTYEFKPEAGIKYSRITSLVDDLCLAMKAESILIERVPGKSTVGIEVPNPHREIIHLREVVESSEFSASPSKLTLCLGKDITGKIKIGDLAQMPHLLIAGSTGAGKSVAINSMILSMLFKATPEEVKLILIDPKRLELGLYDGIPHLYTPIVTEPKQAANVLRRATLEMEARLKKLAEHGVRNIDQYNKIFEPDSTLSLFDTNGERERPLPYLVIVIDELADLMMVEPQNVEESITRLAQMARAVGIHLILATQRPSVDVITGLIKANLPSRISFRVASKVDSRTILDSNGSEALLGRGDMLFMPPGTARLLRLHGPLVTEKEIGKVVDWWKAQSEPHYNEDFLKPFREKESDGPEEEEDSAELDEVYDEAVRLVVESGKASTSLLQRRLRVGYGRAARLIDLMQRDGIVGAPDGSKPREVLKRPDWLSEVDSSLR
jgi:DNA segregation ATPase FtsK/SpoIIIE, S-DNA-T family